jgi:glucokinase
MKLIAGDIGGTKTILRLVEVENEQKSFKTLEEATYKSQDYLDLVPMIEQFLEGKQSPEVACLAIAGPVVNNSCQLTNLNWYLEKERLERSLNLKQVSLINDFAAVSYGILGLTESDLDTLQTGEITPASPLAVIGAGTGLGESFLIPQAERYQVFATEGGHTDFASRSELEWQLLEYIKNEYSIDRVSVERVVSGPGIVVIYQFLRDIKFAEESTEIGEQIRQWEAGKTSIDPAAIIGQAALVKSDPLCQKTIEMFLEAYGAETGNLALKILPYGGIYIAGGIAAKILPIIKESNFIEVFKQKGRMVSLLEKIPIKIVLNSQVGLLGSLLYALA